MKTDPVPSVLPSLNLLSSETLAKLANVYDEESHAVTLYFNRSTFSDKAHRGEALTFEHLVKTARDKSHSGDANPGLSKDLARILDMEPEFRSSPSRFRAIFACSDKQIWHEINLPVCGDFSRSADLPAFSDCPTTARHRSLYSILHSNYRARQSENLYRLWYGSSRDAPKLPSGALKCGCRRLACRLV